MNVTLNQYKARLAVVAAKWGADDAVNVADDARWSCPLGTVSVGIALEPTPDKRGAMHPTCRTGTVGLPFGAAWEFRRRASSAIETVDRALGAFCEIHNLTVWLRDCPCGHCSGRGYTYNKDHTCEQCDGAGVINDPDEVTP